MKYDHCVACSSNTNLHQHHLVPKSRGGSNDETNLITLCRDCHTKIHGVNNSLINLSVIAQAKLKAEGKLSSGQVPYGKMLANDKKTLIDNPIEQQIIGKICELKVSLHCGSETIINKLEELNYRTRKGGRFHAKSIIRILKEKGLQQNGYIRFNPKQQQQAQKQQATS